MTISQYTQIWNHYVVYPKLIEYVNHISIESNVCKCEYLKQYGDARPGKGSVSFPRPQWTPPRKLFGLRTLSDSYVFEEPKDLLIYQYSSY